MLQSSPTLVEVLRSTLRRLEDAPDIDPNDPKLQEFKTMILRSIAELEVRKANAA